MSTGLFESAITPVNRSFLGQCQFDTKTLSTWTSKKIRCKLRRNWVLRTTFECHSDTILWNTLHYFFPNSSPFVSRHRNKPKCKKIFLIRVPNRHHKIDWPVQCYSYSHQSPPPHSFDFECSQLAASVRTIIQTYYYNKIATCLKNPARRTRPPAP